MGVPREDGLPRPYSAEAEYLAAILDAIRGLSQALSPQVAEEKPADEVDLVEAPKKTVAESEEEAAVVPPAPIKPKKPVARKPRAKRTRKAK